MNYLMSLDHHACWVVFIAKLSRMPSGSHYIGFQGGECRWRHDPTVQSKRDKFNKESLLFNVGRQHTGTSLSLVSRDSSALSLPFNVFLLQRNLALGAY